MAQAVRDVMSPNPRSIDGDDNLVEAARVMRDADVGAVIVLQGHRVSGLLTDRDIVVRALADERDPAATRAGEIASRDVVALGPEDSIERAVELMSERSVRRLPVIEGDTPVGIVSLGDLAIERDSTSALAEISAAPANV